MTKKTFSVIVTGLNVQSTIDECIQSLLQQDYPENEYEIIYIDGGSTDSTLEKVSKYPVRILQERGGSPASGRNTGIKKAQGIIIAFTDADSVADKNWLKELLECYDTPEVAGVGGVILPYPEKNYFPRTMGLLLPTFFGSAGARNPAIYPTTRLVDHNPTNNSSLRKQVLEEVGYFNEELKVAEDIELDLRIINKGYKLIYTPKAKVRHHGRQSLSKFILQMYNYGIWRAWAGKRYPGLLKPKHLLPSLFLLFLIFSALFTTVTTLLMPISLLLSVILLTYLSTGLITGLKVSLKSEIPSHVIVIPILGFIEHVSYGLGILYGLLSELPRA
ncbi:glycosyltransferase [Candidatus Borrarchaeum sp.]|uniref:glycosyltransferase n=1 Tax=Candidatus Borrarchaeum sp. TaxID=2846742 RepID=UPI002580F4B8|nr:glycosyltransferase [Candidatus Borrarchaeum sp.]